MDRQDAAFLNSLWLLPFTPSHEELLCHWPRLLQYLPSVLIHLCSWYWVKVKVLVTQSCLTLCHPMDCSPPGSSVHGILQARILGWVDIPFSRRPSQPRGQTQVSSITSRFFTIWTPRKPLVLGKPDIFLTQTIFKSFQIILSTSNHQPQHHQFLDN